MRVVMLHAPQDSMWYVRYEAAVLLMSSRVDMMAWCAERYRQSVRLGAWQL